MRYHTLRHRADFLRLQQVGQRVVRPSVVCLGQPYSFIEASPSAPQAAPTLARIGYTATKKVLGPKAVCRNRAKRRLRAAVRYVLSQPTWAWAGEVVLVARAPVLTQPFPDLCADLHSALTQLWQPTPCAP